MTTPISKARVEEGQVPKGKGVIRRRSRAGLGEARGEVDSRAPESGAGAGALTSLGPVWAGRGQGLRACSMLQPGHILSMHRAEQSGQGSPAPQGGGRPRPLGGGQPSPAPLPARGLLGAGGGLTPEALCLVGKTGPLATSGLSVRGRSGRGQQLRGLAAAHAVTLQGVARPREGGGCGRRDHPPSHVSPMHTGPASPRNQPRNRVVSKRETPNTHAKVSV
ncbi:unnamed protein product [Rangifer tarandus platyrhynchus]|nr:unnamed protein product [Rangifer tarandus platyrhynchus]CAI9707588.1 unnamed protein product [Rangifer tarandus platyrhynchus]